MLEVLIIALIAGLVIASVRPMRLGNPFQLYFLIWACAFAAYWPLRDTFVPINVVILIKLALTTLTSLLLLLICRVGVAKLRPAPLYARSIFRNRLYMSFAQAVVLAALPFVYLRAAHLAGTTNLLTVAGFTALRASYTDGSGSGLGLFSYLSPLAMVLAAARLYEWRVNKAGFLAFAISLFACLFYLFFSTGRTFILLFSLLLIIPLVINEKINVAMLISFIVVVGASFVVIAWLTQKGLTVGESTSYNLNSFLHKLRAYTIAPIVAFSKLMSHSHTLLYGQNTFRTLIAVAHAVGLTSLAPLSLVKSYEFVPDPTNVYTVYAAYVADYGDLGYCLPSLFLVGHWYLYKKSIRHGGVWMFYYAASVYPLIMQFFQDQYFSLLSQWIQIVFWILVFAKAPHFIKRRIQSSDYVGAKNA